jgi:hypothetical protein
LTVKGPFGVGSAGGSWRGGGNGSVGGVGGGDGGGFSVERIIALPRIARRSNQPAVSLDGWLAPR